MSLPFVPAETPAALVARCARHGLALTALDDAFDDVGLDFRVAHAVDGDGVRFVVREPRRADVIAGIAREARALQHIAPFLPVAVPRWVVADVDAIAYARLPGEPVLELTDAGHRLRGADTDVFVDDLARFLAALWRVPMADGIVAVDAAAARAEARAAIAAATPLLAPPAFLVDKWRRFVDDDALWPAETVMTHGDLHPGHALVDLVDNVGQLRGVLDWTEAKHTDKSVDLAMLFGCYGAATFERIAAAMAAHGAHVSPQLVERAKLRWAAWPTVAVMWAQKAGNDAIIEMSRAQVAAAVPDETA